MAKLKLYYNKVDNLSPYGELQWQVMNPEMSSGSLIIFKQITLPFEHKYVQKLIDVYNSPSYQDYTLNKAKRFFEGYFKNIYLDFVKTDNGYKLNTENESTKKALCTWRVELDTTDKDHLFRLSPFDFTYPNPIYAAKLIDKVDEAKKVIDEVIKKDLAGIKYLEETA